MSTYVLTGEAPAGTRFVTGINTPGQPASYLSGRRGAKLAIALNSASHNLGKDPIEPYAIIGQVGVIEVTAASTYTLSATPTISAGFDGQEITLVNAGSNNIILQDNATLAGSTLFLTYPTVTLYAGASIVLTYSSALVGWSQTPNARVVTSQPTGVYLPTHVLVANLTASTRYNCQWVRMPGNINMVIVTGKADLDATNTGVLTRLGIQLPIASTLAAAEQCAGTANSGAVGGSAGVIIGDVANARAELNVVPTSVTNDSFYFSFMYQIL